jgi:hypothetical protein
MRLFSALSAPPYQQQCKDDHQHEKNIKSADTWFPKTVREAEVVVVVMPESQVSVVRHKTDWIDNNNTTQVSDFVKRTVE